MTVMKEEGAASARLFIYRHSVLFSFRLSSNCCIQDYFPGMQIKSFIHQPGLSQGVIIFILVCSFPTNTNLSSHFRACHSLLTSSSPDSLINLLTCFHFTHRPRSPNTCLPHMPAWLSAWNLDLWLFVWAPSCSVRLCSADSNCVFLGSQWVLGAVQTHSSSRPQVDLLQTSREIPLGADFNRLTPPLHLASLKESLSGYIQIVNDPILSSRAFTPCISKSIPVILSDVWSLFSVSNLWQNREFCEFC